MQLTALGRHLQLIAIGLRRVSTFASQIHFSLVAKKLSYSYDTQEQSLYSPYSDSPAIIPGDVGRLTADCTDCLIAYCNDLEILRLLDASTTHSTKRSYESDLRHFVAWAGALPATSVDVARYLAAYAGGLSVATLARRLVAIGQAHAVRGFLDPTKTELVRRTMRGVRRTESLSGVQRPLTTEVVLAMTARTEDSLAELRDRALLLLGFAGGFRRSELVAIDCGSLAGV